MATDNKQKVLIRSMSVEEIENYMINSDLNGKIIPQNEDTWHHNYNDFQSVQYHNRGFILSNESITNKNKIFVNKINIHNPKLYIIHPKLEKYIVEIIEYPYILTLFRPLIEYKE